MAVLKRHSILAETIWLEVKSDYDAIKNPSPDVDVELDIDYSLTEFGFSFITACKRPSERA
jgi:hypothetical protein